MRATPFRDVTKYIYAGACVCAPTLTWAQTDVTATGSMALSSNTTGDHNTATGAHALRANTSGTGNTADGRGAMRQNTTGNENTGIGVGALYYNLDGDFNTAVGYDALASNTSGDSNVALGHQALNSNTSAGNNIAIGPRAMFTTDYGGDNVAIGPEALYSNVFGQNNVAIGPYALRSATNNDNVAIGDRAMYWSVGARDNVAIGARALYDNGGGYYNTAVGSEALAWNFYGQQNTGLGYRALQVSGGMKNVAVGYQALYAEGDGSFNTAVGTLDLEISGTTNLSNTSAFGYNARATASNTIRIGNSAVTSIGGYAPWTNLSDARFKTHVRANVPGLDFVTKLRPVTFRWDMDKLDAFIGVNQSPGSEALHEARLRKQSRTYTGFLAQEVEAAANECSYQFSGVVKPANDQSHYELAYAEFVVPLVQAVQEQQKQIEELKRAQTASLAKSSQATLFGTPSEKALLVLWLASVLMFGLGKRFRVRKRPASLVSPEGLGS